MRDIARIICWQLVHSMRRVFASVSIEFRGAFASVKIYPQVTFLLPFYSDFFFGIRMLDSRMSHYMNKVRFLQSYNSDDESRHIYDEQLICSSPFPNVQDCVHTRNGTLCQEEHRVNTENQTLHNHQRHPSLSNAISQPPYISTATACNICSSHMTPVRFIEPYSSPSIHLSNSPPASNDSTCHPS